MPRCDLCFKDKGQLQQPIPKLPARVCKGCFYEIDRVIGFLEHYGFAVTGQMDFEAPKRKKRATKAKEGLPGQETS